MSMGTSIVAGSLAMILVGAITLDSARTLPPGPEADDIALSATPIAPQGLDDEEVIQLKTISELKADARGHFIADARIDGTGIRVLVDTGASVVALSYEDAEATNLRPHSLDYTVPVSTANGVANAARVTLRRVEVAGVEYFRACCRLLKPQGAMAGTLLGMSFLSRLESFKVEDGVLTLRD